MRFYILDDDINVIRMVSNLIEDQDLGNVVGTNVNPLDALKDMESIKVDICLIDYLMPHIDGGKFIKTIKIDQPNINFIMISQVNDSKMISDAYLSGAEFFIHKPINAVEFKKVVQLIKHKIELQDTVNNIKSIINIDKIGAKREKSACEIMERIFSDLGIIGEKGINDIIYFCEELMKLDVVKEESFNYIIEHCGERSETVKQRMRRAIGKAQTHIAYLGIEDFNNEIFVKFAYSFFDFQSIRDEMEKIKKKKKSGGKVDLFKFINALILETKDRMNY